MWGRRRSVANVWQQLPFALRMATTKPDASLVLHGENVSPEMHHNPSPSWRRRRDGGAPGIDFPCQVVTATRRLSGCSWVRNATLRLCRGQIYFAGDCAARARPTRAAGGDGLPMQSGHAAWRALNADMPITRKSSTRL